MEIGWPTLHTIIYNWLRDILLDQIRPERFLYESEAQYVTYDQGSTEMTQFISELKLHQEGNTRRYLFDRLLEQAYRTNLSIFYNFNI